MVDTCAWTDEATAQVKITKIGVVGKGAFCAQKKVRDFHTLLINIFSPPDLVEYLK
jgi:hypothetical protein